MNFIPSYSGVTKSITPLYEPDFSSIDWPPIRKELKLERDGEYFDVPNRWEILRSDNQAHLGVVSNRYEPIPYQDNVKTLIKAINEIQINKLVDDSSATISIEPLEKGKKLIAAANIICRTPEFQEFMEIWASNNDCLFEGRNYTQEEVTKAYLRQAIKVESFKELKENQTAQRFFNELRTDFEVKKLAGEV